ncbi:MBOAT family O-acyltransferase [Kiloniella antarctica]|uniref:Probable alginate O-acetylase AlgI n=1 Tax=Kiloniella antarctica TaxID=1550907 RepID=A0ABW5BIS4_9PROT
MVYLSFEWIGWMVGVTAVFWATPQPFKLMSLAIATAVFLIIYDPISCGILVLLTLITYGAARLPFTESKRLILGLTPIFILLFGYKALSKFSGNDLLTGTIIPLGLSYYTLRCAHYLIETYKGNSKQIPLLDLVAYLFFLPTIFIGPIHRQPEFSRDLRRHRWNSELFSEGIERIIYGYFKIAVLGNFLISRIFAESSDRISEDGSILAGYLLMVQIGLNLYFQFSGFSDIAIGFARLLGFRVLENFNWPYFKSNISAFWNSWHISLTSWCRDYVYGPVVAITRSPSLGSIATLIAVALWHEISIRYLLWGLYHGLGIILWQKGSQYWRRYPIENPTLRFLIKVSSIALTTHYVWFGFYLVREIQF